MMPIEDAALEHHVVFCVCWLLKVQNLLPKTRKEPTVWRSYELENCFSVHFSHSPLAWLVRIGDFPRQSASLTGSLFYESLLPPALNRLILNIPSIVSQSYGGRDSQERRFIVTPRPCQEEKKMENYSIEPVQRGV
jgi:hypothetical protein